MAGLKGSTRLDQAQATAYQRAGYLAKPGNSSESAASRLLRRVKPILDRVRELQEQEARKRKLTVTDIVDELEQAREIAKDNCQPAAMVAATSTKAKVLGLSIDRVEQGKVGDFSQVKNQDEIATSLLISVGLSEAEVSADMRAMALEALAHFNERLAAIAGSVTAAERQS